MTTEKSEQKGTCRWHSYLHNEAHCKRNHHSSDSWRPRLCGDFWKSEPETICTLAKGHAEEHLSKSGKRWITNPVSPSVQPPRCMMHDVPLEDYDINGETNLLCPRCENGEPVSPSPFSKGYKTRYNKPVSDACGDERHFECTQTFDKCHCKFRGGHTVMHAYMDVPVSPSVQPPMKAREWRKRAENIGETWTDYDVDDFVEYILQGTAEPPSVPSVEPKWIKQVNRLYRSLEMYHSKVEPCGCGGSCDCTWHRAERILREIQTDPPKGDSDAG